MKLNYRSTVQALVALWAIGLMAGCGGGSGTPATSQRGVVVSSTPLITLTQAQVNAQAQQLGLPANAKYGIQLVKIDYKTPDIDGALVTVSGVIVAPTGAPGALPLVSYQHGTEVQKSHVPSAGTGDDELGYVALNFAAQGYVVAAADYLGLGDSAGLHPYLHADSEASACVDMIRAARKSAPGLSLVLGSKLFLAGYSQGGHATLALQRSLERDYKSEFTVTASAPGDGPYDLSGTELPAVLSAPAGEAATEVAYILLSYKRVYNLYNTPSDVFASPYDTLVPMLFDGLHSSNQILTALPISPQQLLKPSFVAALTTDPNNPVIVAAQKNNVYDWKPVAPIKLLHAKGDMTVPYQNSTVALARMTQLGATNVTLVNLGDNLDHISGFIAAIPMAKAWFDTF